ncbi:MAG: hypothetical protein LBH65_06270 [Desulfovibrio sp.]|nr:hypothetical protein [Desulfovibrio sp.]
MTSAPKDYSDPVREAEFVFPTDFAGFDGHFPGDPMLPGIAQIMAAALTVSPSGSKDLRRIGRSKFMSMVRPGDRVRVRVECRESGTDLKVSAQCETDNGVCAQFKLVMKPS